MKSIKLEETYAPHPFKWWHIPLLILLVAGTVYVIFSNKTQTTNNSWQRCEGSIFGTLYHITYQNESNLDEGIARTLFEVDNSLSTFNEKSVISAINMNSSQRTDPRFETVVSKAIEISNKTDGAFDITVAPFVNLWGFGFKNAANVSQQIIDSLKEFVGINNIKLKNGKLIKSDPRTMLDCNAIAKGYGVDAVSDYLESQGVNSYMVEIGGEVRVKGLNPNGVNWRIGINEPIDDSLSVNNQIQNVLEISNRSMATSGNYRNFYVKNNVKYAHTIDPKTGYPVQHSLLSATVIAKDCMTADAFATAFMVCGIEKAKRILNSDTTIKAYFIYSKPDGTNEVWHSEGLNLDQE